MENLLDLAGAFTLMLVLFYVLGDLVRFPWAGRPLGALAAVAGMIHLRKLPPLPVSLGLICLTVLINGFF